MTSQQERPIVVGDRFESLDARDEGRVVEVVEAFGIAPDDSAALEREPAKTRDETRMRVTDFHVRTEAHPKNPDAIGNVSRVSEWTLRTGYKRVSR